MQIIEALFTDYFCLNNTGCFPKDILELMHVPGLTRMQVASHLQVHFIYTFTYIHTHIYIDMSQILSPFPAEMSQRQLAITGGAKGPAIPQSGIPGRTQRISDNSFEAKEVRIQAPFGKTPVRLP